MQTIRQPSSWFSKQKRSGKVAIGCAGLFVLWCLCSVPYAIFELQNALIVQAATETSQFLTQTESIDEVVPTATLSQDLTVWRKVRSPLFPSNWAPTAETIWVRYTFAYGSNPAELIDSEYVTWPLSKTECKGDVVKTTELSNEMAQAAIQGILPLDDPTRLLLQNEKPVTGDCVMMTQLPDPNLPDTKELIAYYHVWFKYNGAFLDLIRKDHTEFIDWVMLNE